MLEDIAERLVGEVNQGNSEEEKEYESELSGFEAKEPKNKKE